MREKLVSFANSRRFKKIGLGSLVSAGILIGAILIAYAVTSITISNTGSVTVGAANLALATPVCSAGGIGTSVCEFSAPPSCSATSGTYNTATASYTISDWSVVQGGSENIYVCLQNTGASHVLATSWAASSSTPPGLTCTINENGTTIPGVSFLAVTLSCTAALSTSAGAGLNFGSFTIS